MAHGPGEDGRGVQKGLKQRHHSTIAIGGVIGAGSVRRAPARWIGEKLARPR